MFVWLVHSSSHCTHQSSANATARWWSYCTCTVSNPRIGTAGAGKHSICKWSPLFLFHLLAIPTDSAAFLSFYRVCSKWPGSTWLLTPAWIMVFKIEVTPALGWWCLLFSFGTFIDSRSSYSSVELWQLRMGMKFGRLWNSVASIFSKDMCQLVHVRQHFVCIVAWVVYTRIFALWVKKCYKIENMSPALKSWSKSYFDFHYFNWN